MSRAILMSIRPQFANGILDGSKTCEFRTRPCGRQGDEWPGYLVVYRSGPAEQRGIVAVCDITAVTSGLAGEVWRGAARPGITEGALAVYADGGEVWRFDLGRVRRLTAPVPLAEVGITSAPQSWRYLPMNDVAKLANRAKWQSMLAPVGACEKCWNDAYVATHAHGRTQFEHYLRLLAERAENPCEPAHRSEPEDRHAPAAHAADAVRPRRVPKCPRESARARAREHGKEPRNSPSAPREDDVTTPTEPPLPHRRFRLELSAEADTLDELAHVIDSVAGRLWEATMPIEMTSGGARSGYTLTVREDESVTAEQFRADLKAWMDARRAVVLGRQAVKP
jgi:predicted transcriptional regulator